MGNTPGLRERDWPRVVGGQEKKNKKESKKTRKKGKEPNFLLILFHLYCSHAKKKILDLLDLVLINKKNC